MIGNQYPASQHYTLEWISRIYKIIMESKIMPNVMPKRSAKQLKFSKILAEIISKEAQIKLGVQKPPTVIWGKANGTHLALIPAGKV